MIYTESEVKSTKFEIRLSIRRGRKRRISDPVKIKATDLTKREFNALCKLISKFNKPKSRKQA